MSNPFEKVQTYPPRGQLLCLLGAPGMGKSSWAAQWPGVRFVIDPRDEGIIDLVYEQLLPIKFEQVLRAENYIQFKANLYSCLTDPSCKTIVLESISGIQDLCWDECSRMDHGNDMSKRSFLNYQEGPIGADSKYFKSIVDTLQLAQNRGKHSILTGHTKVGPTKNVDGDDWLKELLDADPRFAKRINATFSNIFHIVDLVDPTKKGGQFKAGEATRFVHCTTNPKYFAKNRMGLLGGFPFPSDPKAAYLAYCKHTNRNPLTGYRK